jgi:MFS family permease
MTEAHAPSRSLGALEPLRDGTFRTIWLSSLVSNFGQLILGVGAAWEMTRISPSADMVALVQAALMLPLMLVSVPAGAIADMFDRRKVALVGLGFASSCAALLTALDAARLTTPWMLLVFCSLIGGGVALYGPAWQASVREQVGPAQLPAAVALGSISYNVARSVGPAIGGVIVLAAGAKAAFATNALCYLPMLAAFFFWRRPPVSARLPPERIDRAIVSGARYVIHSPPIRTVLVRALIFGVAGSASAALTPLVARDLLHGNAATYGLLLGATGVGAVGGALLTGRVRMLLKPEHALNACALVGGVMFVIVGVSHSLVLTAAALAVAGGAWMMLIAMLNVGVQLSAPRWVTARALAWYLSALTGGIAGGAWLWGHVAVRVGVGGALVGSGVAVMLSPLIGLLLPMPDGSYDDLEPVDLAHEPDVALALTLRSGPIAIEIDYRVDPAQARQFYGAMLTMQQARRRNGAFDWSLARDIADPALWTERYHCPTWGDYLRLRSRFTHADRALQSMVNEFHQPGPAPRVRRRLERPFGSVRWRTDTPDPQGATIGFFSP